MGSEMGSSEFLRVESEMGSSDRLFNRQRTVHEVLGGGLGLILFFVSAVADVLLWRRKNVTMGLLLVTVATWVVFERSGYTLVSLVASVLLLLLSILFLWSKSAALLNRPAPPLPRLHLSEETVNELASSVRHRVNSVLSTSQDIALGKDTKLFFKVSAYLLLLCIVGCSTGLLNLGYTSLIVTLTVPALYERYEDRIDRYLIMAYKKSQVLCTKCNAELLVAVRRWTLEKEKLS